MLKQYTIYTAENLQLSRQTSLKDHHIIIEYEIVFFYTHQLPVETISSLTSSTSIGSTLKDYEDIKLEYGACTRIFSHTNFTYTL